jgi:4-diphosphocytidyl-2-C-methyl-D-erythritol kinase
VPRSLTLRPPAKINLVLRVGPRRTDGYHEVQTLLQSIALSDRLLATLRRGPFTLVVRGAGVPADRTNLVWRAAEILWRALGRSGEPCDAHLTLEKEIPAGAGLGGGSADAAAALVALNRLWEGRLPVSELAPLGSELGADVPFFLMGGTALGLGRGDDLYPLADVRRLGVVLLTPSFGVSTAEAYRWFDEDGPSHSAGDGDVEPVPAVDVGWHGRSLVLGNDLEAPVSRRHRDVAEMVAACRREGAWGAGMTGSGSAVFGLFPEPAVRAAARRLRRPDWRVIVSRTLTRREARQRVGV